MKTKSLTVRLPESLYDEIVSRTGSKTKTDVVVELLSASLGITPEPPEQSRIENMQQALEELKEWRVSVEKKLRGLIDETGELGKPQSISKSKEENDIEYSPIIEGLELPIDNAIPSGSQLMTTTELLKVLKKEQPASGWDHKMLKKYREYRKAKTGHTFGLCFFKYANEKTEEKKPKHQFWVKYPVD